jgi:hypothetical protein
VGFSLHKSEAFNPYLEHEANGVDFFQRTNDCYLVGNTCPINIT